MRSMKELPHLLKNSRMSKPRHPAIGLELTGKKRNLMTISPYVLEQYCRIWVKLFFWPFFVQFSVTFTPYSAKNQYRKLKNIFPEKELRGHSPNCHIHVSVSDLLYTYIPRIDLPILLQEICDPILGKYKYLTYTWMWKLGLRPRNFQRRNT